MTPFAWTVRVRTESTRTSTVYARNNAFPIGDAISFRPTDTAPTALEMMLGAFCADITATFKNLANRKRLTIDAIEFTASCTLNNPLIHVGVHGETGHAGVERIDGTLYVTADAEEADLESLWEEALHRSPLYNTLSRAATVDLRLNITP